MLHTTKRLVQMFAAGAMILHDNSQPQVAIAVTELLERHEWQLLLHTPYSPHVTPYCP